MKWTIFLFAFLLFAVNVNSQLITYSETNEEDVRDLKYEIIGKLNGNIHIYKNNNDHYSITLFDAEMKEVSREKLTFLPDKIINENFLLLPDSYLMFYQYQKKGIVYCMSAKFDNTGKPVGAPIELDTTKVSFLADNKIYTVINSDDKQKVMVVKISKPDEEKTNHVTTTLYNGQLQLLKKSKVLVSMKERNASLSEFVLDNSGDLAFIKSSGTGNSEIVNKLTLINKQALEDSIHLIDPDLKGIYLDDIHLKVDNYNKHYLITSFFSKQRAGHVEGVYCYLWDKTTKKDILNTNIVFNDEFRADAKDENSIKDALDDFFLRNIVAKRDGGFVLAAESYSTSTTNNNPFNRWDNYGSPYSGFNNYSVYGSNGMYYNPYSRNYNNITSYYATNIIMLSVDVHGKMEWSNIIHKSQRDESSENYISYGVLNTGDRVHFLFNAQTKREYLLNDQSISPDGQLVRSPAFRGLNEAYEFMPRFGKQTGGRQIVLPCQYRNYICFAKIDY